MKKLFPLLALLPCLVACNSAPALTPQQAAVTAYLKNKLDDPASYQPVGWGKMQVWHANEKAKLPLQAFHEIYSHDSLQAFDDSLAYANRRYYAAKIGAGPERYQAAKAKYEQSAHYRDTLKQAIRKAVAVTDTAVVGYFLTHVYRAKNKTAALVLDSARFQIDTKGEAGIWEDFKRN